VAGKGEARGWGRRVGKRLQEKAFKAVLESLTFK